MAVVFKDAFTGTAGTLLTAHTPNTGGAYSKHGTFGTANGILTAANEVRGDGAAVEAWLVQATAAVDTSFEVHAKLRIKTTVASAYCGFVLDVAVAQTGYLAMYHSTGVWLLQKCVAGTTTTMTPIFGSTAGGYADATDWDVRWQVDRRVSGQLFIRLYVNGVHLATWQETSSLNASTKKIALRFINAGSNTTGFMFDGVSLSDIALPTITSDTVSITTSSTGNVITLTGVGTDWDATQPVFLVSGATKTAQSITNATTATVTLTAPSTVGTVIITAPYSGVTAKIAIRDGATAALSAFTGWSRRRQITLTGSASGIQHDYQHTVTLHRGLGTDTATDLYMGRNVRTSWTDLRITDVTGSVRIPFGILKSDAASATIVLYPPVLATGSNIFYCYFKKRYSFSNVYKIACLTDTHYDATETLWGRNLTLTWMDNFVARMAAYRPDLAVNNGDKCGASSSNAATQLSWYQSNESHFAAVSAYATAVREGIAPGNHDFEYMTFATVLAEHSADAWKHDTAVLYDYWESTDYRFISLDSNYKASDSTHHSASHTGNGFINATQLTWLLATLASSTKPVIVFCHHPLCEADTTEYTLTKALYHTDNREAVRNALEASGKVVCVIHGHVHWTRIDVINNIPYLMMQNIGSAGFFETPTNTVGRWSLIEIDKEAQLITFITEGQIGSSFSTLNRYVLPFSTIYHTDIPSDVVKAYSFGNTGGWAKASIVDDPCQLYINDLNYIYTMPVNDYAGEPRLSTRTFKIQGRTNTPNFGRATWEFSPQQGKFRFSFSARLATQATKYFKLGGVSATSTPGPYLVFHTDGNIKAFNGATLTTLQAYSANTWYAIKLVVDTVANTYSVYVDGTIQATNFAFNNANTFLRQLEIVTEAGDIYVDNLRIEKYISPEPVIASWQAIEGSFPLGTVSTD